MSQVAVNGAGSAPVVCTLKPTLSLGQDYFSVFGFTPSCQVDLAQLSERYRALQQAVHPDKFLRECDRSQRLAQQQAALVNAAYQTLKSPLARAQYLLELAGERRQQDETTRDTAFLLSQLALREELEAAAQDLPALDALHEQALAVQSSDWTSFVIAWEQRDWPAARLALDKLQFAARLTHDIEECQARLLDA